MQNAEVKKVLEPLAVLDMGCVPPPIRSPRGASSSKEDKKNLREQYKVSNTQFGHVLDCLMQVGNALEALRIFMAERKSTRILFPMLAPDGKQLRENQEPLFYVFTKKHWTEAKRKYLRAFKQLKTYHLSIKGFH